MTQENPLREGGETADVLATPSEEMKLQLQMDAVREYTVRPGLMRLPVHRLDSSKSNEKWRLELDHPWLDPQEVRFFIDKPRIWDPSSYEWCELLDWYGLTPGSQYELQRRQVYVRYDTRADEWTLVKPPSQRSRQARRYARAFRRVVPTPLTRLASVLSFCWRATGGRARRAAPTVRTTLIWAPALVVFVALTAAGVNPFTTVGLATAAAATLTMVVEPPEGGA